MSKANAATLQAWLKEKGVAYKSKDKKADLVSRVHTFLGIPLPQEAAN